MTPPDGETAERSLSGHAHPDPPGGERMLEEIDAEECFALLEAQDLGRLAVVDDGRPYIFPVNYALDGHTVVIRTQPGIMLTLAPLAHVAFEVEDIDPVTREGWVVVVSGVAQDITNAIDQRSEHERASGVRPWVMGSHEYCIIISHSDVSGRRLRRPG
jgi:hypothetical protein